MNISVYDSSFYLFHSPEEMRSAEVIRPEVTTRLLTGEQRVGLKQTDKNSIYLPYETAVMDRNAFMM